MPTTFDFLPLWQQIAAVSAVYPDIACGLLYDIKPAWSRHCDPATIDECAALRRQILSAQAARPRNEFDSKFAVFERDGSVFVRALREAVTYPGMADYEQPPARINEAVMRAWNEQDVLRILTGPPDAKHARVSPSNGRMAELLLQAEDIFANLRRS